VFGTIFRLPFVRQRRLKLPRWTYLEIAPEPARSQIAERRRRLKILPLCPEHRVIVLAMVVGSWAANAGSAQALDQRSITTSPVAAVKARVARGDVVYVTDTSGTTIEGKLAELTDDAVRVTFNADVRTVAAADVRRIQ
jgi:hypothetical protein